MCTNARVQGCLVISNVSHRTSFIDNRNSSGNQRNKPNNHLVDRGCSYTRSPEVTAIHPLRHTARLEATWSQGTENNTQLLSVTQLLKVRSGLIEQILWGLRWLRTLKHMLVHLILTRARDRTPDYNTPRPPWDLNKESEIGQVEGRLKSNSIRFMHFCPLKKCSIQNPDVTMQWALCTNALGVGTESPTFAMWPWGGPPAAPDLCFLNLIKEQDVHKALSRVNYWETWKSKMSLICSQPCEDGRTQPCAGAGHQRNMETRFTIEHYAGLVLLTCSLRNAPWDLSLLGSDFHHMWPSQAVRTPGRGRHEFCDSRRCLAHC